MKDSNHFFSSRLSQESCSVCMSLSKVSPQLPCSASQDIGLHADSLMKLSLLPLTNLRRQWSACYLPLVLYNTGVSILLHRSNFSHPPAVQPCNQLSKSFLEQLPSGLQCKGQRSESLLKFLTLVLDKTTNCIRSCGQAKTRPLLIITYY